MVTSPAEVRGAAVAHAALEDLGPLAWVLDETRKSIESSVKLLKRFAHESELALGSAASEVDAGQVRTARQQLHQVSGALDMVGQEVAARVVRGMEDAVQQFVLHPDKCDEMAASVLERAGFALIEYLENQLGERPRPAVGLFWQHRQVLELAGAERIHPADLWSVSWKWAAPATPPVPQKLEYGRDVRSQLDQRVLKIMRAEDAGAASELCSICLGLAAGESAQQPSVFWRLAAGFFDGLAHSLIPLDAYTRRAASRILLQYASLARGDQTVSDQLCRDLLFFCAQARPASNQHVPVLAAVRQAWSLDAFEVVPYAEPVFGLFDPAVLQQARRRIESVKENWSALAGGDMGRLKGCVDQFGLAAESLVKLHEKGAPLAEALLRVATQSAQSNQPPAPELAMETATAILFLEASFADFQPSDPQFASRILSLSERLNAVCSGGKPQPLEPWMEELYRHFSERQTMGTVIGELRATLHEVEQHLDQFFRNPVETAPLDHVPGLMIQMRGVLSVLGLDQAAMAVSYMRQVIDNLLAGVTSAEKAKGAGLFETLGNSLGALGFLIDTLAYQPVLAKKLFVYDEKSGELKPLMGRTSAEVGSAAAPEASSLAVPATAAPVVSELAAEAGPAGVPEKRPEVVPAAAPEVLASDSETVESSEVVHQPVRFDLDLELAPLERPASAVASNDAQAGSAAAPESASPSLDQFVDTSGLEMAPEPSDAEQASSDVAPALLETGLPASVPSLDSISLVEDPAARPEASRERSPEPVLLEPNADGDDELLEVFLEEARDVIRSGSDALWALQADPLDVAQQTTLRRAFHTLKGSARMVGLTEFGEAAWSMEQLLSAWIAEGKPATLDLRELSGEVLEAFGRWVDDIAAKADESWQAAPFSLAADALRSHGQRLPLLLGQVDAADKPGQISAGSLSATSFHEESITLTEFDALPEMESHPAEQGVAGAEQVRLSSEEQEAAPALAPVELPDLEFPQAEVTELLTEVPAESSQSSIDSQPLDLEWSFAEDDAGDAVEQTAQPIMLELPDLELLAEAESPAAGETSEIASAEVDSVMEDAGAALGSDVSMADFVASAESVEPLAEQEPGLEEASEFESLEILPEVLERDSLVELEAEAVDLAQANAQEGAISEFEVVPAAAPDEYKYVGGLSISIPLYNVYLNEADEWSRRLSTDLSEWSLELQRQVPEGAISSAHSLAGASATVGFAGLSGLAREVEHALQRLCVQSRGTPEQAQVLNDAAEEVRRVLHQFAAGILKDPSEELVRAVAGLIPVDYDAAHLHSGEVDEFDFEEVAIDEPAAPVAGDSEVVQEADSEPVTGVALEQVASAAISDAIALAGVARQSIGDGIDAEDAIDQDLLPIFQEEAQELLPRLAEAMRRWAEEPENMGARSQLMRVLHTLKGSARLVGAMRLGEMAHRAESNIEVLGTEGLSKADLEPMVDRMDELQAEMDRLLIQSSAEQAPDAVSAQVQAGAESSALASQPEQTAQEEATERQDEIVPERVISGAVALPATLSLTGSRTAARQMVRVRSQLLDRLVNEAGEVITSRTRLESNIGQMRTLLSDLSGNLERLRAQLRDVEIQAETQMQSRLALSKDAQQNFDPLEFDRFTRMQELTRMMAESVNDIATVQRGLQRTIESSEDDLAAQSRQSRELQRDLLRTRMVEFDALSERLYRAVRQASKESGKRVRLEIVGGSIEIDRGILERMTPSFEHLLRNCVGHGIESSDVRLAHGKSAEGVVTIDVSQSGNDVSVEFRDDGSGLNVDRIRDRAVQMGLIAADQVLTESEVAGLIFSPGFSTASEVTELSGRGIGMNIVLSEIQALGGRIETNTRAGEGSSFRLVMPLTTAVTNVIVLRAGNLVIGVPSNLIEVVRRSSLRELQQAYEAGHYRFDEQSLPFFWAGSLLQSSRRSAEMSDKTLPVVILRSAEQRIAIHVDEVQGNHEVVVKNLGPQLSRLPGLVAATTLASGDVMLIYNPVALATVYGPQALVYAAEAASDNAGGGQAGDSSEHAVESPLVLVVDDSITVRRVTQRLLQREGYRVALAADGLQGLKVLQGERPAVVLSDIEMPRMDGFDFVRSIRANEKLADLPVVMITSRIAEKHRELARELGVNHYLGKPYSEDELLRLVGKYSERVMPS